jgi:hypothetical protein
MDAQNTKFDLTNARLAQGMEALTALQQKVTTCDCDDCKSGRSTWHKGATALDAAAAVMPVVVALARLGKSQHALVADDMDAALSAASETVAAALTVLAAFQQTAQEAAIEAEAQRRLQKQQEEEAASAAAAAAQEAAIEAEARRRLQKQQEEKEKAAFEAKIMARLAVLLGNTA